VLLLSSVPFEEFGYRTDLTRDPLPIYTYRVLSRIPDFVPLGGMMQGGAGGLHIGAGKSRPLKVVRIQQGKTARNENQTHIPAGLSFWPWSHEPVMAVTAEPAAGG